MENTPTIFHKKGRDDDGCWKKKSKSVPRNRIYSVKSAIASNKPINYMSEFEEATGESDGTIRDRLDQIGQHLNQTQRMLD